VKRAESGAATGQAVDVLPATGAVAFAQPLLGGITQGLAGTSDVATLIVAQPFAVQTLSAWDADGQRFLIFIPGAPAHVNTLNESTLRAEMVVMIKRTTGSAPVAPPPAGVAGRRTARWSTRARRPARRRICASGSRSSVTRTGESTPARTREVPSTASTATSSSTTATTVTSGGCRSATLPRSRSSASSEHVPAPTTDQEPRRMSRQGEAHRGPFARAAPTFDLPAGHRGET